MIESFHLTSKIAKVHYADERGIIEEPYDSAEDMLKKKGFVYQSGKTVQVEEFTFG